MTLAVGTRLDSFEIIAPLGAGGMGEVYRAHDTTLKRDVAIKVLPEYWSSDPKRLHRFEQEAQAAAALNHPNIVSIFHVGQYNSLPYIVTELLHGETLRERLRNGPLRLREAIDVGINIARGLAAAHDRGIVHRDLKPENLFLTKDGHVKILDFGLAKLGAPREASGQEATLTLKTEPGMVLGTAGYMAPEQVRGKPADHRSDIFALGVILYEMVTGKQPFRKATSAETMAAILNDEPPSISQITPNTPPGLQRVVHRCLEKNPEQRFHSAHDLAFALEALSDSAIATPSDSHVVGREVWSRRRIAIAAVVAVIALGAALWLISPARPPRVSVTTQLTRDSIPKFSVVTDGSRLYIGEGGPSDRITEVSVNGGETSPISTPFANAVLLDISSDHTKLLINSHLGTEANTPLWSLPLPSGAPRQLAEVVSGGATLSPDGQRLLFVTGYDIYQANADGSNPSKLVTISGSPFALRFSPDGHRIRFTVRQSGVDSLWEIRDDGSNLHAVLRPDRGPTNTCCGGWSGDGRYFFFINQNASGRTLWVMREPAGLFRWGSSEPLQLTTGPLDINAWTVSPDGRKLFVAAAQRRAELVRYDLRSKQFVPFLSGSSIGELDYSTDGQWVTYISYPDGTLWRSRADGSDRLQLTYPPVVAGLPRWSPNGTQIAFIGRQAGRPWKIFLIPSQGGTPQQLLSDASNEADPAWSPDGKKLAFGWFAATAGGIHVVDLANHQVSSLPGSERLFSPRWSPDGQYIAALNTESTKLALYNWKTQTWSDWVTEPGVFGFPNWSRDSKYLYYDIAFTEHQTFRRVKVGQSHSEVVADLKGLLRYSVPPAYGWSGVAPDGSALFDRDLSTDEIYALDLELP